MSRVIKFRAWDKKENVMEDVNIMAWGGANALKNPSGKGIQAVVPEDGDVSKPGDFVLMQFTGLLDKNGREIYEGDILEYGGVRNEVKYDPQLAMYHDIFGLAFSSLAGQSIIISTIYESEG